MKICIPKKYHKIKFQIKERDTLEKSTFVCILNSRLSSLSLVVLPFQPPTLHQSNGHGVYFLGLEHWFGSNLLHPYQQAVFRIHFRKYFSTLKYIILAGCLTNDKYGIQNVFRSSLLCFQQRRKRSPRRAGISYGPIIRRWTRNIRAQAITPF